MNSIIGRWFDGDSRDDLHPTFRPSRYRGIRVADSDLPSSDILLPAIQGGRSRQSCDDMTAEDGFVVVEARWESGSSL
jgi:hypothetical protein